MRRGRCVRPDGRLTACLVQAHYQLDLLADLVRAVRSPVAGCFVHVDAKSPVAAVQPIAALDAIASRVQVLWGGGARRRR